MVIFLQYISKKHKPFGTKIYKLCDDWIHVWYDSNLCFSFSFLDGIRKYHTDSRIPLIKDLLETMTQVSRLEQHSTKVGLPQLMTVTQPKCGLWTAKGVMRKGLSEVWQTYDVCVCVCVCVHARARACSKVMFLTLLRQVTTPQILKLEFPIQIWGLK